MTFFPIQLHREHRGPQSSRRPACSLTASTQMKGSWFERKTFLCYLRSLLFKRFETKIVRSLKTAQSLAGLPNLCVPLCPLCNFLPLFPKCLNREWTRINANKPISSEKFASIRVHSRFKTKTITPSPSSDLRVSPCLRGESE